jgi:hypothetical protein
MCSHSMLRPRHWSAAGAAAAALAGCSVPMQSARLGPDTAPVEVEMLPAELGEGQSGELVVRSAGADSIVFESLNGVDRYWTAGPELRAVIAPDFGDPAPLLRYADHRDGRLLDLLKKPARIAVCRRGRCSEHYHEIAQRLPERNRRSVALTAGWSSVFARRSILGADRTVLFKEALTSGVWAMHGEWASGRWNAQARGFTGGGEHGASLDVARTLMGGESLSYGIAMHVGMTHSDWLSAGPSAATGRTAYRAGIGPSVMLKGITASSLLGIYSDGLETLQISSTRVSINGNLTSVRHPVTLTAEKTFAFGGGAIVSRRRDALERLTAGIRVVDDVALNIGVSSHRMAWPEAHPSDDLRATETVITLGGQYSVTW